MYEVLRAMVNQPSKYSPYHHLHGKVGHIVKGSKDENGNYRIYFTEGKIHSQLIKSYALDIVS